MLGCRRCMRLLFILALTWAPASPAQGQPAEDPGKVMLWQPGDPGERLFLTGRVVGADGRPLAGAVVQLRQADGTGLYREARFRARLQTTEEGAFNVATVLPGQYRGPKHIHLTISHGRYPTLTTRIVFKGDPNLDQARTYDLPILLEEVHQDGEKVLVGDVELVLGAGTTD